MMPSSRENPFGEKREKQEKPLIDREDLLNAYDQTKERGVNITNENFDDLFRQHIPYKHSNYNGQAEKKRVIESMNEWITSAFNIVQSNYQGHGLLPILTENLDEELVRDVGRAQEDLENELESRINQRKTMPLMAANVVNYSLEATTNAIDRVEFVVEDEEDEEDEEKILELPKLKRPLEKVKEEYKKSYELLDKLDEDLSIKRSKLETYQDLAKRTDDILKN